MNNEEITQGITYFEKVIEETQNHIKAINEKEADDDIEDITIYLNDLFSSLDDMIDSYRVVKSKRDFKLLWEHSDLFLLNGIFEGLIRVLIIHEDRKELFELTKNERNLDNLKPIFKKLLKKNNVKKSEITLLMKCYEYFQIQRNNFNHFSLGSLTNVWDDQLYFQFFAYVIEKFELENKLNSWEYIQEIAQQDIEMCSDLKEFNLYKK